MMKTAIIVTISILLVVVVVRLFIPEPMPQDSEKTGTGKVVLVQDGQGNFLGIKQNFTIRDPFAHRSLRPTNIPLSAKVGQHITYSYQIVDVVGTGKWDVYVKLVSVHVVNK